MQQANDTNQKKGKKEENGWPVLEKDSSGNIFDVSFNHSCRNGKNQGKNTDKMCQLIFLKIYLQQQKQWDKNPLYIYWEYQYIYLTSYLKLQNINLLHLLVDIF